MESLVAMLVLGVILLSLYSGINFAFYSVRVARENLRATEIMVQKTESIRICAWDQISSNNIVPPTFTETYGAGAGVVYEGTIAVTPVSSSQLNANYNDDLRQVTVSIKWNSGSQDHRRQVTTYVSRYGLQSCLFN